MGAALGLTWLTFAAWAAAAGCGARTELSSGGEAGGALPDVPPTGLFCAEASYDSGPTELSMMVLLDRSGSMNDADRWSSVSAALSAFADDPAAAGLGMGL